MTHYVFYHNGDVNQESGVSIDAPDEATAVAEFSKRVGIKLTARQQDVLSDYYIQQYGSDSAEIAWKPFPKVLWIKKN
ncbi:MAG: hypothetical protein AAF950_18310 [Pseudomonadota bacterium]